MTIRATLWFRCLALVILAAGSATPAWACYAVVAGRKATVDGSVLLAHNEENGGQRVLYFHKIPRQTHAAGTLVELDRRGHVEQAARRQPCCGARTRAWPIATDI